MKTTATPETNELIRTQLARVGITPTALAAKLTLKCENLERERNALRDAIRLAVAKHEKIAWGYDGDAGSNAIMSELEDSL